MKKIILVYCILLFIIIAYPLFISTGNMYALDYMPNLLGYLQPEYGDNLYLLYKLGLWTKGFVPAFVWERIFFLLTFGLGMFGGYTLLKGTKNIYAILFGVSLLMINPFFYERIVDGQVNVYLASAGMILYVSLLQGFFEKPNFKKAIFTGIFSLFLTLTTIHAAYFIALACCVFFIVYSIESAQRGKNIKYGILLGIITIGINAFWAGPIIKGYLTQGRENTIVEVSGEESNVSEKKIIRRIESFGAENQKAFETTPGKYGVYLNVLMMKGYWSEQYGRFLPSQGMNQKYVLIMMCIGGIIVVGLFACFTQKNMDSRKINYIILCLGIFGYVLSLGMSQDNIFSPLNTFLYEHLPLYKGFREPHKWSIFLIIAYGYFGSYGVKKIYDSMKRSFFKEPILLSIILLPLLYTPSMLLGLNKQLTVRHFPQEWEEIHAYAQSNITTTLDCANKKIGGSCYTFLYFPWHEYIGLQWVGRIVNSSILFSITNGDLIGDNIEVGNIYSTSERKESKIIEHYIGPLGTLKNYDILGGDEELTAFQKEISDLGIQYIILLKEADFFLYKPFLDAMVTKGLLKVEKENTMITLYKNIE